MDVEAVRMDICRTTLPMRTFVHASAVRDVSEAVVVRLKYSDGWVGWGETLPRRYVTGETIDSVIDDLEQIIWPQCVKDGMVLPISEKFPVTDDKGRCINAAACAMDLAAVRRFFDADGRLVIEEVRRVSGRVRPRKQIDVRVSGVLGSSDPGVTARQLRKMRLFGLQDFKLKLGLGEDVDAENLRIVYKRLGRAIRSGNCTLRVDVNGGWDLQTTPQRVAHLKYFGVCVVEQPVYCSAAEFVELACECELPLMADETLLSEADARILATAPERVWWNIRICKNGGLVAALRLAVLAADKRVPFTLGCMVGESSILSAAQRRLLEWGPLPCFVEGNYGTFLLAADLTTKSVRFGYGGKLRPLGGPDLGVFGDAARIGKYGSFVKTLYA